MRVTDVVSELEQTLETIACPLCAETEHSPWRPQRTDS